MQTQRNKLDLNGQNNYAGFDAHKNSWKVMIMTENLTHKTFSQPANPEILRQYLERNFPVANYHSAIRQDSVVTGYITN